MKIQVVVKKSLTSMDLLHLWTSQTNNGGTFSLLTGQSVMATLRISDTGLVTMHGIPEVDMTGLRVSS